MADVTADVEVAGFDVSWVAETGSTNADLLLAAQRGAPANLVLAADYQSQGKGRRGRSWQAAAGSGLLFSVLIRPQLSVESAGLVTTALAFSAAVSCEQMTGVRSLLKWPNDLVVQDRKLAGVLAESVVVGGRLEAVIVGMGLNVRSGSIPVEIATSAVDLEGICNSVVDRKELLAAILVRFAFWMGQVEESTGQAALVDAVRQHSATLGRQVLVELGDGTVLQGLAQDLDHQGALLLADGTRIVEGDVVHLRKA
ncbi:MAG: biotin--[acetyl-CoA-carboxylase] ligase [Acidimicrobiia bacterium]|nr:biotin--[acetyl-CoA-carboxylase] ligase [Acidimicrobiia bacterium]MYC57348.1 biotin--[acetyl-CoA-carboxylase] ligase [Acidimicrobiia bacterium]MYG94551.1 biotin--[acetyl-CoA-carboxylase] ligase [Acidimicrobiia bacterium]MYI30269.1 biotin--[acetyl-CoA-carboxylase] ligase [Acidimicrobiia bacterium]